MSGVDDSKEMLIAELMSQDITLDNKYRAKGLIGFVHLWAAGEFTITKSSSCFAYMMIEIVASS